MRKSPTKYLKLKYFFYHKTIVRFFWFGKSNLFAQNEELLFVSQKHQSFLRPFLSPHYGTSPFSLYSLARLTHFITFCCGGDNDLWHVLLPSSNYLRCKWLERRPFAPALWPSPASPYPSTSIRQDSSFSHGELALTYLALFGCLLAWHFFPQWVFPEDSSEFVFPLIVSCISKCFS